MIITRYAPHKVDGRVDDDSPEDRFRSAVQKLGKSDFLGSTMSGREYQVVFNLKILGLAPLCYFHTL